MLSIRLICVGKLREQFYVDAFAEYSKRLSAYCKFECIELNETKLGASPSDKEIAAALDKEAGDIERAIGKDAYVIEMCVEGRQLKSEDFARRINELAVSGRGRLCFVVGGSFGLSPKIKQRADMRVGMSEMTFPHHLARVMALEQLYRAESIQAGTKYHK